MSREIKFRAWDGEKMLAPTSIYNFGADDGGISIAGQYINYHEHPDGKLNLMQFTGLLDKNGVEIYEGDIVLIGTLEGKPLGAIEWVEDQAHYEIKDNERYQFGGEHVSNLHTDCFEVLGNIYENPELLND